MRVNAWLLRPMLDFINVLLAAAIYTCGQRSLGALEIDILCAFVSNIGGVVDPLIQITLDGIALSRFNFEQSRADVGLVPQNPFWFVSSARDTIAMGGKISQYDKETAACGRPLPLLHPATGAGL